MVKDRDTVYGDSFRRRLAGMGISEVIASPSSPWQNPYADRLIGSLRRECLDHVIVLGERHLRRILTSRAPTGLSLPAAWPSRRPVTGLARVLSWLLATLLRTPPPFASSDVP